MASLIRVNQPVLPGCQNKEKDGRGWDGHGTGLETRSLRKPASQHAMSLRVAIQNSIDTVELFDGWFKEFNGRFS